MKKFISVFVMLTCLVFGIFAKTETIVNEEYNGYGFFVG